MSAAKIHLSLNVTDVDRSTIWYETLFGVPAHKRRPGYANFDIQNPDLKLALQQGPVGAGGALNHLGVLVESTDEVHAAKERLEKAGLVTFSEENVTCCYALQDKIWVRDPDGNPWEIYALLDDLEHEVDHGARGTMSPPEEACCQSTCCSD